MKILLTEKRVKMQLTEMRRRRLEEKECELKESLMKFEKFLKDNDDKRARALKKLSLERGIQKQRLKQIDELNERIQKLTRERKNLDTKVKRLRIFKDFLEQVVKRSDDFNDISELMKRYESLTANLSDLMEKEEMNSDMSQNLEIGLHKYREDKCDEKMFLLNKLTELRRSLELHQIECRDNQVALEHEKDATVWRIIQLNSIKLAIQNMYQLARKFQRFGSEANADDTKSQLSVIASFILDLSLIVKNLSGQASTVVS
ncbi:unnamed protein product [Dicrocoelium dendriticum]|nr:unnamed protein product [Dicrocoelium dendriticum]